MSEFAAVAHFGLLLVRPGLLVVSAPVFGGTFAPAHVKIGLTVLLALALLPVVPVPPLGIDAAAIGLVVVHEAAVGLALGLAIKAFVAAVELAGHLSGFQLGLSYSAIVDPQSGVRNNLVAALYVNLAVVAFFLVNGHHAFLRALGASYDRVPIGGGQIGAPLPAAVIELLGLVFVLGTRLAAPLVLVLILVEVAMGLLARTAPLLNLMAVEAPVRLAIGLLVLAATIPAMVRLSMGAGDAVLRLGMHAVEALR